MNLYSGSDKFGSTPQGAMEAASGAKKEGNAVQAGDRKSTRLNSSHL